MDLSRFWALLRSFIHRKETRALPGIHSAGRFRSILERERARSDRNHHEFSVVLFDVGNAEVDSAQLRHLANVLADRVRLTDEAGWFDSRRIGILLPHTSSDGAWRLADDVCQAVAVKAAPLECTVYTYPSGWFSDGDGHLGQLHFADVSAEWKATTSRGFSVSAEYAGGGDITFTKQRSSANMALTYGARPARGLESFFFDVLPAWKRATDIVGALLGLAVASPFLLLAAVIIKIVSPGPVFFKQQRVGYMGKTFTMWKLRTMKLKVDTSRHQQHISELVNNGQPMTKLNHESQLIPFGKIFRATYLDELPQLLNVLYGQMSLVGPRPAIAYEVEEYMGWYNARFDVLPGMSGLWQVSGKNRLTFDEMIRLDIQYAREQSPWSDIKILLMTPYAILSEFKDTLQNKRRQTKGDVGNG